MRTSSKILAAAALVAGGLAAPAGASFVQIGGDVGNSTEGFCDFTGTINYDYLGGNLGELTISLTNTTDAGTGGYLTGFVFNIDGLNANLDLTSATHPFTELTDEKAQPFGAHFHSGAALGGDWTGGGSPLAGIEVGDTGTFTFDVNSASANIMDAQTFLKGAYDFNFVVRFKGLNNGKSDKVPGGEIPAPGALALLGAAGLTATRRRRA
jgi:MYXO-CTERM domain-containing protein